MSYRLLTDTCAALKLAAFGDLFFKPGVLACGDLILHQLLFNEIKKWNPQKKNRFNAEFKVVLGVRATSGLVTNAKEVRAQVEIINITELEVGVSVGRVDKEILATTLLNPDLGLVSNDRALSTLASEGFEKTVLSAEEILLEGLKEKVLDLSLAQTGVKRWLENGDSILPEFEKIFREEKIIS